MILKARIGAVAMFLTVQTLLSVNATPAREVRDTAERCNTQAVFEGETATMTFILKPGVRIFANLLQKSDSRDLLICERKTTNTPVECQVKDPRFKWEVKSDVILTVQIPDVTIGLGGTYMLKMYVDGTPGTPSSCTLTVNTKPKTSTDENKEDNTLIVIIIVLVLVAIIAVVVVILYMKHKRLGPFNTHQSTSGNDAEPLQCRTEQFEELLHNKQFEELLHNTSRAQEMREASRAQEMREDPGEADATCEAHDNKSRLCPTKNKLHRSESNLASTTKALQGVDEELDNNWYRENISPEEQADLLKYEGNGPGSFQISKCRRDPNNYDLVVKCTDRTQVRCRITTDDNTVIFDDTKRSFKSLDELVTHYTRNEIKISGRSVGKLTRPLQNEPTMRWYFRSLKDEEVRQLKNFHRNTNGSFLIKQSSRKPGTFDLLVIYEQNLKTFRIETTDEGFTMLDTQRSFKTLPGLVECYRQEEITAKEARQQKLCCKLTKPLEVKPTEIWYCGQLTRDEEEHAFKKALEHSFLIRDGITNPDHYTLSVKVDRKVETYRLQVDDKLVYFCDARTEFSTLFDLVEFYKKNDIVVNGKSMGNLKWPIRAISAPLRPTFGDP